MIGLDTNVLLRYLVQDDPAQSPRATEIVERRLTDEILVLSASSRSSKSSGFLEVCTSARAGRSPTTSK